MKTFMKRFCITFTIINFIFLLLSLFVYKRFGIEMGFIRLTIGALVASSFVSFSISVFKANFGNSIISAMLGYIVLLPAVFVTRRVFGIFIFRFSFMIYLVSILIAMIYGTVVLILSMLYKREDKYLNGLLINQKEEQMTNENLH